jgi:hypothetical protein
MASATPSTPKPNADPSESAFKRRIRTHEFVSGPQPHRMWRARHYSSNAGYETPTRRPSRRCSRVRRPRFPQLAPRPHPSRHGYECLDSNPGPSLNGCGARANIPQAPETKQPRGGDAAAVAGYAGPGFHHWPTGHIPQAPDTNALNRIRLNALEPDPKTRSEKRSPRRAPTPSNPFFLHRPGGSGVSDPSYRGGFADGMDFSDRVLGDGGMLHRAGSNDAFVCS